jgi:hypothetical protein
LPAAEKEDALDRAGPAVRERALHFFDYAPDATRHLIEVAELDAANRNEDGSLRPLGNHADRQLVTVTASQIIDRAWGKPKEFDPASEKPATPEFNPRDYSPAEHHREGSPTAAEPSQEATARSH